MCTHGKKRTTASLATLGSGDRYPQLSSCKRYLACCVQFWAPSTRETDVLERIQWRTVRWQRSISSTGTGWFQWDYSLDCSAWRGIYQYVQISDRGSKDSVNILVVPGDRRKANEQKYRKLSLRIRKIIFSVRMIKQLWKLCPWRHSKAN